MRSKTASASVPGKVSRLAGRQSSRTINDYSRDELITALLRGMGKKWWTRDAAIRAAASRLGFRRTGSQIRDAFKSAINGAIRRGLLDYEGLNIRKQ